MATFSACANIGPPLPPTPTSPVVVAWVPTGDPPMLLAAAPDGRHVYAAANGALAVIDTATNHVVAKLPATPNSTGIAVAPNGSHVYVTALFSTDLTILDTSTNTLTAPMPLLLELRRGGFSWMALSPDGATAYIVNEANAALAIVELASGHVATVMPDLRPIDVAIAPDGRTVYLAGCKAICTPGFVQIFDTVARRFTGEIAVASNPYRIAVSPNGTRAYTANFNGPSVSVVDLAAQTVVATVPVPVQPTGLTVSADSRTVWVASLTSGALTAIDATTNQVRGSVPIVLARDVAVTPDGRRVYVSSDDDVAVVDATAVGGAR